VVEGLPVQHGEVGLPAGQLAGCRGERVGVGVAELGVQPAQLPGAGLAGRQGGHDPVPQRALERDGQHAAVAAAEFVAIKLQVHAGDVDAVDRGAGHAAEHAGPAYM
jgi:hypothetical protein